MAIEGESRETAALHSSNIFLVEHFVGRKFCWGYVEFQPLQAQAIRLMRG
jgi:hypothetical protein